MSKIKILHLSLLVSVAMLNSSAIYSSSAAPIGSTAESTAASTQSRLQPKDMLLADFLQDKSPDELQAIKRRAIEAVLKKTSSDLIPFLEEAIRHGYVQYMVALGEIYEQQEQIQTAYEWYILAFEEHWIKTG